MELYVIPDPGYNLELTFGRMIHQDQTRSWICMFNCIPIKGSVRGVDL